MTISRFVIRLVLVSFIFMLVITNVAYGLMTKEKLEELVKEKNKQEGIVTVEPEPKAILEGLKGQVEGQKQWQKLEEQRKQQEEQRKQLEEYEKWRIELEANVTAHEKEVLGKINEILGTNYTSREKIPLEELQKVNSILSRTLFEFAWELGWWELLE